MPWLAAIASAIGSAAGGAAGAIGSGLGAAGSALGSAGSGALGALGLGGGGGAGAGSALASATPAATAGFSPAASFGASGIAPAAGASGGLYAGALPATGGGGGVLGALSNFATQGGAGNNFARGVLQGYGLPVEGQGLGLNATTAGRAFQGLSSGGGGMPQAPMAQVQQRARPALGPIQMWQRGRMTAQPQGTGAAPGGSDPIMGMVGNLIGGGGLPGTPSSPGAPASPNIRDILAMIQQQRLGRRRFMT